MEGDARPSQKHLSMKLNELGGFNIDGGDDNIAMVPLSKF
jgi:hypothetical protein